MPIYISMLRGINVGGNKRMKMDQLRKSFEALGLKQVKTYIQSGNVIFEASKLAPAVLSKRIEQKILSDFGFSASVITRTLEEFGTIIETNPLVKKPGIDPDKLHVAFLSEAPAPSTLKKLAELTTAPDQSYCSGKEVYLYFPNGVSQSSLWKTPLDRILSVAATTRNWKTVNTVHQMCKDCR